MHISRWNTSPRSEMDGVVSYLLVSSATAGASRLSAALVEMRPGAVQPSRHMDSEKCYFILEGHGLMTVGEDVQRVEPGDCVFIPVNTAHIVVNDGDGPLHFLAAAAPSFGEGSLAEWLPPGSLPVGPGEDGGGPDA